MCHGLGGLIMYRGRAAKRDGDVSDGGQQGENEGNGSLSPQAQLRAVNPLGRRRFAALTHLCSESVVSV